MNNVLFLNFLVMGTEPQNMRKSVQQSLQNPLGFSALNQVAVEVAARMISEDGLAATLAEQLPEVLRTKLLEMGCEVQVTQFLQKGSFLALKVTVLHANMEDLNRHVTMFDILTACAACNASVEADVTAKLIELLPQKLPEKIREEGLIVEVVAKSEAEEPGYLQTVKTMFDRPTREYCTPASISSCCLQ
eukprot:TRINITY_DN106289_c0_g1_i1.p1 TRINITY_DN106289_c0_g1~~TRINITY_DN106289_c0_g1_i1.p1  ORF type:complete len:190 (+),score=46.47 TRINITY_DN106289_c0_g1_i1:74-643(+)